MRDNRLILRVKKTKLSYDNIIDIAFILFFCSSFLNRIFAFILSRIGLSGMAIYITCICIYLPIILIWIKVKKIKNYDFFILLIGIICFIAITYLIHPEYEFWYKRNYYGIWDYVLRPDNGIYAYLFIRLVNDPKRILKNLKICGWIMYLYYAYQLAGALSVGYWIVTNANGIPEQLSYDLSFGYNVLFFTIVFMYYALDKRNISDITGSLIGIVMILLGGSRGPFMCIVIFIILFVLMKLRESNSFNKRIVGILLIALCAAIIAIFYENIILLISSVFETLGVSSRTLQMLLSGSISDDNGRQEIWNAAIQMIRDNPFGYGALGTRHVIYYLHDVGHCHQVFLEILVDFGVIAGGIIILFCLVNSLKILFLKRNEKWSWVFLIFFSRACQLILSGTYWHVFSFWACLGIGMCCYFGNKKGRIGRIHYGRIKDK